MKISVVGSKITGWELVVEDTGYEPIGVVENAPFDDALDAFAANWPEYAAGLDELKSDDDFVGVQVHSREKKVRGVAGERKRGSGARFRELILQGKGNEECVRIVRSEFPESKATLSDAAWQRAQLKKNPEKFMVNSQVIEKK